MRNTRLLTVAALGPDEFLGGSAHWSNSRVLERCPNIANEWNAAEVAERFGVQSRQWTVDTDVTECDLATGAGRRAMEQAGMVPSDVDLLVTATSTPSAPTQSLAGRVAKQLDLRAESFDVRAGGAAGVVALHLAQSMLSPHCKNALVVMAENISPWCDLTSNNLANLMFADGAVALLLRYEIGAGGQLRYQASTHSVPGQPFTVPGALPPEPGRSASEYTFQAGDREYAQALDGLRKGLSANLARLHREDEPETGPIGAYFPMAPTSKSQAGQAQALGLDLGHSHTCLRHWGCPGSAAPFIALAERRLDVQSVIAFTAVGGGVHAAGMTWFVDRELL